MPRFWVFLCKTWLGLSSDLAATWWHALGKSRWTEARTFHQMVLRYDQHPAPAQRPTEDKLTMSAVVGPQYLMQITEDLVQEAWQDLPAAQRLTKYREWRDAQQGEGVAYG